MTIVKGFHHQLLLKTMKNGSVVTQETNQNGRRATAGHNLAKNYTNTYHFQAIFHWLSKKENPQRRKTPNLPPI